MLAILIGGVESVANLPAPAAVTCGELVEFGNTVAIAKADAASGATAAFAVGGGIYKVTEAAAGGPTVGSPAYLSAGALKGAAGKKVGLTLAKNGNDFTIRHDPDGSTAS